MQYGNSASDGMTGSSVRSASAPWPISRRPGLRMRAPRRRSTAGSYSDGYNAWNPRVIDGVERLEVADGAKRHVCKHLGPAAGEKDPNRGEVRGRTPTSAANGRFVERAAVDTLAFEQAADDLLLQFIRQSSMSASPGTGKVSLDVLGQRGKAGSPTVLSSRSMQYCIFRWHRPQPSQKSASSCGGFLRVFPNFGLPISATILLMNSMVLLFSSWAGNMIPSSMMSSGTSFRAGFDHRDLVADGGHGDVHLAALQPAPRSG